MAVIAVEGFETRALSTGDLNTDSEGVEWNIGRDGIGRGINSTSSNIFTTGRLVRKRMFPQSDTVFGHLGIWINNYNGGGTVGSTAGGNNGSSALEIQTDDQATQINVQFDNLGYAYLRRGNAEGGMVLQKSTLQIPVAAAWHSTEFKLTLHPTAGEFVYKVDGVEFLNFTGQTRATGTSNRVGWVGSRSKPNQMMMDDLYVVDSTGVTDNSWTGEVTIVGLIPNGNGTFSELMGSDGNQVNNYQQVDEIPANSTDYNGSATTGLKDTYTMSNVTRVGTVLAVQTYVTAVKSDTGPKSFRYLMRAASGTMIESAVIPLSTTYVTFVSPIYTLNPDGLPWTTALVDELEIGAKVV